MYFTVYCTGVWKLHASKQQIHCCKFNSRSIFRCFCKNLTQFIFRFFEALLKQSHHKMHSFSRRNYKILLFLILQVFIFQNNVCAKINTLSAGFLGFSVLGICLVLIFWNITDSKIHICLQIPFHFFLNFSTGLKCKIHTFLIFFLFCKQKDKIVLSCSSVVIT